MSILKNGADYAFFLVDHGKCNFPKKVMMNRIFTILPTFHDILPYPLCE